MNFCKGNPEHASDSYYIIILNNMLQNFTDDKAGQKTSGNRKNMCETETATESKGTAAACKYKFIFNTNNC